jgi:hypothetical protein
MSRVKSVLLITSRGVRKSLSASASKQRELKDWWDAKPKPIRLYEGEKEIFRQGPVLVTDTRISHIDPFDRELKTYMFEHMISLRKNFYQASTRTRRICKALIIVALLTLLFTIIVDLMGEDTRRFIPVYFPLLISLIVGLIVWRDMRPKYRVEWFMRDGTSGGIKTEPLFREWMMNNQGREKFMNNLVDALNEAMAGKAWWPKEVSVNTATVQTPTDNAEPVVTDKPQTGKAELKLVTDHYQ